MSADEEDSFHVRHLPLFFEAGAESPMFPVVGCQFQASSFFVFLAT
jgi:hypothetical protein